MYIKIHIQCTCTCIRRYTCVHERYTHVHTCTYMYIHVPVHEDIHVHKDTCNCMWGDSNNYLHNVSLVQKYGIKAIKVFVPRVCLLNRFL